MFYKNKTNIIKFKNYHFPSGNVLIFQSKRNSPYLFLYIKSSNTYEFDYLDNWTEINKINLDFNLLFKHLSAYIL